MKAISLWQPWASLVASGIKTYETRHWRAPQSLIGKPLAIHAAKRWTRDEWHATNDLMRRFPRIKQLFDPTNSGEFTVILGAILVVVRLVDCISSEKLVGVISDEERACGNFAPDRYGWKLEIIKLPEKPIVAKGMQGIWDWYPETYQE